MKRRLILFVAIAPCMLFTAASASPRLAAPIETPSMTLSGFGYRKDPFTGASVLHSGIDYEAAYGAPVRAAAGGVVVAAGPREAYGVVVEIDHGGGLRTLYAHLSRVKIAVGAYAAPETPIGEVGASGRSAAPHLHFEVLKNGAPVDPRPFLD